MGLQGLPRLRFLNLTNTRIGDAGLIGLTDVATLRLINASGAEVTASGVLALAPNPP